MSLARVLGAKLTRSGIVIFLLLAAAPAGAQQTRQIEAPWWWDDAWWTEGRLPSSPAYPVEAKELTYKSGDEDVAALLLNPQGGGKYPPVLFVHGRRGLDDVNRAHARRLAAQGFVVLAPDLYQARFIPAMPIEHDYVLEDDTAAGLDHLLTLPEISAARACLYSISRGGYYTLKAAVTKKRQATGVACYVGYYPHLQDPNAPEPMQVYRYAPEVESLTVPTLLLLGDAEQYQRRRGIEMAAEAMRAKGRDVTLALYPGVGRGFDFRERHVRTFADDLAARDAMHRASAFMRRHMQPFAR
ncbi:MAG: dienelactone hydrolase [Rhodospirillales bacterium]|nr:dienelactone hydrolase [Rhodospirillales bacterium]MSP80586.1 dienelactone hydrolase [Rhodospirillales bacterium]